MAKSVNGQDFSFKSHKDFDNHISASVSSYDQMHDLIRNLLTFFIRPGSSILDIGCTTGKFLNALAKENPELDCYGIDIENLITEENDENRFKFYQQDFLEECIAHTKKNIITSIFTMQFIEPKDKQEYIQKAYDLLHEGGVLILCEKIITRTGLEQKLFTFSHYDQKRKEFSEKEILGKETKLRKIMFPNTETKLNQLVSNAGFNQKFKFFQSLYFIGYICIKE